MGTELGRLWEHSVWGQESRCSQALRRAGAAPALLAQQRREGKEDLCHGFSSPAPSQGSREEVVQHRGCPGPRVAVGDGQMEGRGITTGHGEPPLGSGKERQGIT